MGGLAVHTTRRTPSTLLAPMTGKASRRDAHELRTRITEKASPSTQGRVWRHVLRVCGEFLPFASWRNHRQRCRPVAVDDSHALGTGWSVRNPESELAARLVWRHGSRPQQLICGVVIHRHLSLLRC